MELTVLETSHAGIRAGYSCPCGCTPSVSYTRGAETVEEGCCCGNQFAVGPRAGTSLGSKEGFRQELQTIASPWGERLEAAWLVGPSVHGPSAEHHQDDHGQHGAGGTVQASAIDPVCGMKVEPEGARIKKLHTAYRGRDYFFCGKGCKLEFDDDPKRYLDPSYLPSM